MFVIAVIIIYILMILANGGVPRSGRMFDNIARIERNEMTHDAYLRYRERKARSRRR